MTNYFERFSPRTRKIGGIAALLLAGALIGGLFHALRPTPAMAPAAPQPIATAVAASALFADPVTTVRGQVTAVYGDSFTLKDASGQALVQTGRGQRLAALLGQTSLVAAGQTVTVQGRQDGGTIRAHYIITPDGRAWAVGGHRGGKDGGHHGGRDHRMAPVTAAPVVTAPVSPTK
jgi:hypothetical protein